MQSVFFSDYCESETFVTHIQDVAKGKVASTSTCSLLETSGSENPKAILSGHTEPKKPREPKTSTANQTSSWEGRNNKFVN